MDKKTILITGANGFIGRALYEQLSAAGFKVIQGLRGVQSSHERSILRYHSINQETDWRDKLHEIDTIVHLAARVHVLRETSPDPLEAFRITNTYGTQNLAYSAAQQGVKRFIFLSSIGINGWKTDLIPFSESCPPCPYNYYTKSKLEAEKILDTILRETGLEVVILRPPLVYGPGVNANFRRLLDIVARGIPLPFGAVNNLRSYVSVFNLVDCICRCIEHPKASGEVFCLSDNEDVSTPDLISKIARLMSRKARFVSVPPSILHILAKAVRKNEAMSKLCSSLQIDISRVGKVLGWNPPFSLDYGLEKTVSWYCHMRN